MTWNTLREQKSDAGKAVLTLEHAFHPKNTKRHLDQ